MSKVQLPNPDIPVTASVVYQSLKVAVRADSQATFRGAFSSLEVTHLGLLVRSSL